MSIIIKNNLSSSQENISFGKSNIFVDANDNTIKIQDENANIYNTYGSINCPRHTQISHTVALYQFDGTLLDETSNELDLSIGAGTARYTNIIPGLKGFYFDGSTRLTRSINSLLQITGDLTIMFIGLSNNTAGRRILSCGAVGSTQALNYLYSIEYNGIALRYFAEYDTDINIFHDINDTTPRHIPFHLAMTREAGQVQFYLSGKPLGPKSTSINEPNGGSSTFLEIANNGFVGALSSLLIVSRSLSDNEVKEQYNNTLGTVFGYV